MQSEFGLFPFGEPVRVVEQEDRAPKAAFVLGVYASAVHAQWLDADGRTLIKALAVASEPYIFWRGDGASEIIKEIAVPDGAGQLVPTQSQLNGPGGIALDEKILCPLGLVRSQTCLCDLVPHSCMNESQRAAIEKSYAPLIPQFQLPVPSVPPVPSKLADDNRRAAILQEIDQSRAELLILLGDQPIRWFLSHFDKRWKRLKDFGDDLASYGQPHAVNLQGLQLTVRAFAHPRQIAGLGISSRKWRDLHDAWCNLQKRGHPDDTGP